MHDPDDRTHIEQELAELREKLRRVEERVARFSEASIDGIILHGDGRIVDANGAAARMLGYTLEELVSLAPTDLTVPEERARMQAHIDSLSEEPIEGHAVRRDGSRFPVEIRARTLRAGPVPYRVVIVRDISARRAAEEEIRASEARLRLMLEQVPAILWTADREIRLTSLSGRALRHFSPKALEAVGQNLSDVAAENPFRDRMLAAHRAALEGKATSYALEWGDVRFDAHVEPLIDSTQAIIGAIGLAVDVTELHNTSARLQQSQRLEAVGRLAGGMAHDFSNLLSVISAFTQLVMGSLAPDDARRDDLREVEHATERAAELARQLLVFSRRQVSQPVKLELNTVLHEMEAVLRRVAGEEVRVHFQPGRLPGNIRIDRAQLEQVLMNLVVNARDAMPAGGTITITTSVTDLPDRYDVDGAFTDADPGRYITLDVTDTGTGMTDEVRAHAFEPFFTTKPVGRGTGLGLPMVYGIMRQASGYVGIDSEQGRGTTITLLFPIESGAVRPASPAPRPQGGGETVLLVESTQPRRDALRTALEELGYRVLAARGPVEALQLESYEPLPIDLLVTSRELPMMQSAELAERLRRARPSLRVLFADPSASIESLASAVRDALGGDA